MGIGQVQHGEEWEVTPYAASSPIHFAQLYKLLFRMVREPMNKNVNNGQRALFLVMACRAGLLLRSPSLKPHDEPPYVCRWLDVHSGCVLYMYFL